MTKLTDRTELIVSTYSIRQVKNLKKFGDIQFVSKKMHYVIIFVDNKELDTTIQEINKLRFVKKVDVSPTVDLAIDFGEVNAENDTEE
ncbi:YlbG family protein [Fructilactobacillus fructivorans]|uniref:DUF2129 domain-containing protein n=1 Tax=Fructilactobacillus fructivorans TaxID=1614 RepID=A0A0C1LX92_9LACO|nr:YlbG family protein [Fructilactobacillus fructivorans]KID41275.1 hypothetical protein LfDm3_1120 [Fructilactobacillus fructivorans]KRK58794.1 hypothetical protein FC73_GL000349 [Fructilactobacillus fructivorans]KRN13705.1 hypothetical protein IV37_GL000430 [Fructilactobacillus fructivorans]KRN39593.1 hypothetical protein IV51_GL000960 [Fructilactobacillus fructivorans]KRN43312.1 hypothetical protein IV48_GL000544 [Fructilactobacillus fructivorans]